MELIAQLIESESDLWKSVVFMLFVGYLVSLDVKGLILSQYRDFAFGQDDPPDKLKSPFDEALLHAGVHASLFLLYMALATFAIWIFKELMNAFSSTAILIANAILALIQFRIELNLDETALQKSIILAIGVGILILVWITYGEKIVEDHKSKIDNLDDPLRGQRFDVRGIYWVLKKTTREFDKLMDLALALAVAVDMLAISAVIRVFFDGTFDTAYKGFHINFLGHALFSPLPDSLRWGGNILIFSVGIFAIVFVRAYRAGLKASNILSERSETNLGGPLKRAINAHLDSKFASGGLSGYMRLKLTGYRLLEPFMVFFVISGALFHLLAKPSDLAIPEYYLWLAQLLLALWLWACLLALHGPRKIFDQVKLGIGFSAVRAVQAHKVLTTMPELKPVEKGAALPRPSVFKLVWLVAKNYAHLPPIVAVCFAIIVSFVASHSLGVEAPLRRFADTLSAVLGVCVFLSLYFPLMSPDLEGHIERRYFYRLEKNVTSRAKLQATAIAAALGVLLYMHVTFKYPNFLPLWPTETFISGCLALVVLYGGAVALTWFRQVRNRHFCCFRENRDLFAPYRVSFGDFLTSLGMVCLCWQMMLVLILLTKSS